MGCALIEVAAVLIYVMSSAAFSLKMGVKKGAAAKTHFATAPFFIVEKSVVMVYNKLLNFCIFDTDNV